jgi:hypothetical protein
VIVVYMVAGFSLLACVLTVLLEREIVLMAVLSTKRQLAAKLDKLPYMKELVPIIEELKRGIP